MLLLPEWGGEGKEEPLLVRCRSTRRRPQRCTGGFWATRSVAFWFWVRRLLTHRPPYARCCNLSATVLRVGVLFPRLSSCNCISLLYFLRPSRSFPLIDLVLFFFLSVVRRCGASAIVWSAGVLCFTSGLHGLCVVVVRPLVLWHAVFMGGMLRWPWYFLLHLWGFLCLILLLYASLFAVVVFAVR
jgi:hypothetical protein